jgi:hypothetical protein
MTVQIIEKVSPCTSNFLLERENFWIERLGTKEPKGMNRY